MKKRALSLLMAFVMVIGLLPATVRAAETPQKITTTTEFADMEQAGNYILMADITIEAPYGSQTKKFTGTFDGNGHTIKLEIENAADHYQGAFAYIGTNGVVKNLITAGSVTLAANKNYAGGIAGMCEGTILNCGNTANITGSRQIGGIAGQLGDKGEALIQNCYNTGAIKGTATSRTAAGGIAGKVGSKSSVQNSCNSGVVSAKTQNGSLVGYSGGKLSYSWWYQEANPNKAAGFISDANNVENYEYTNAVDAVKGLNKNRGDNAEWAEWADKEGVPVLRLVQKSDVSSTPEISLKQTDVTLYAEENLGTRYPQQATLTAQTSNLPDDAKIVWEINNEQAAVIIPVEGTDKSILVKAAVGGAATVTATVCDAENKPIKVEEESGEKIVRATCKVTVIPHINTVEIKNINQPGAVAVGQTVQAQVNILGGGEYDYENYPKLTYQWYRYNVSAGKSEAISGATSRTFEIKAKQFDGEDQKYKISVNVDCGGKTVHSYNDQPEPVRSADYGKLYPVAYDEEFTLPSEIKEDTKLELPTERTKGDIKAGIEWSGFNEVIAEDGTVTRPADGKSTVTLKAKFTYGNAYANRTFEITVWSQAAVDAEGDSEKIEAAIGKLSTLQPQFGKDSNVQTMVETRLANAGFSGVGVKFISAEPTNATADQAASAISSIGGITYFYDDPNKTVNERTQWFDTYKAYFTLTCGKETKSVEIPVIVYWDADKVKQAMTEQIVSKVTLPETTEKNFDLPKVVDGKKWTLIEWTSSDRAVTISTEKQGTADTLFEPYVGVVTRQTLDQQVELTAKFTFQLTDQQIVLYKVFYVTVKGNADAADRAALYQQKLDDALAAPGLKDFVTGKKLTEENGVYTTINDIQFPTTRDLKIDGKYTPVVITSSDPGVIEAPTTPNSARVWVYRPLPGEAAKTVTLTMKILDRPNGPQPGDDLSTMRVLASKEIKVTVQPLTQTEIDAEIALMERVKVNYWNGIRNANTDQNNVTTNLHAFQECYLGTDRQLTWVYDRNDLKNHGIVPVPLDNWYDQQIWRLFRSSNADVVAHENLLVTRQGDSKAVTITSYLSSETLGRYAEKYPQNADFQKLYKQPVTIDLVVTGTQYAQGVSNTVRMQAAKRALAVRPTVTVSFSLSGRGMGFAESDLKYAEGSTVYDVFSDLLAEHRYTCKRRGSYIAAITSDSGVTLEEFDEGKNSGWMYRVNGELVRRYMSAQGLKDGDRIELYFTSDWTSEPGAEGWQKPGKIETIVNADGSVTKIETKPDGTVIETTTWRDGSTLTAETSPNGRVETVEKRADGTTVETVEPASGEITASVSVPKSVGSTRVDIPVSKPTGSMVAVIVHPDGTEEIVKGSVVTETGIALRAEGNVRLKIIDNAKRFNDMADHWAKDAVEFASSRELFNGVGNDAFGPDRSMTRGMVNTVLARLAGADTAGGETWYAKGTAWAVENGISDGTAPEQPVTREQLAAMLYRYAGSPAVSGELSFDDTAVISIWAYDAVRWCVDNGILNGVGGNRMTPQDLARRGQVAAMLMRFLQATV